MRRSKIPMFLKLSRDIVMTADWIQDALAATEFRNFDLPEFEASLAGHSSVRTAEHVTMMCLPTIQLLKL
jgi:hypothetical protein